MPCTRILSVPNVPTFCALQGGHIRQQLYELLKSERGVHFSPGNTSSGSIHSATTGMRGAKFCLNLAGDTPSSNRLFDSIASHCVPVIISDDIELPFEDVLDYSEFCLFIKFHDALQRGFLINLLRGVSADQWMRMWTRLQQVDRHFKYQHPAQPQDAVHMIWRAVLRKVPTVKLFVNRKRRYSQSRKELRASVIPNFFFHW